MFLLLFCALCIGVERGDGGADDVHANADYVVCSLVVLHDVDVALHDVECLCGR